MSRIFTMIKRNGQWDYLKPVPVAFLSSHLDVRTVSSAGMVAGFPQEALRRPFFIPSFFLTDVMFLKFPKTKVVEVYVPDSKWNDMDAWDAPHRKWGIDVSDRGWPVKLSREEEAQILSFLDTIDFRDYYKAYHGKYRLELLREYVQVHKDDSIVQSDPEQVVLDVIYNLLTYIKDDKFPEGHSRRSGIGDFTIAGKWKQIKEVYSVFQHLSPCLMTWRDAIKTRFFSDTIKNHLARSIADFLPFAGGVGVEIATWKVDVEIESPDSIPDNSWAVINFRISGSPQKASLEILIAPVGNIIDDEESQKLEYILESITGDNPQPIPQEIQDIIQATEHAIKNTTSVSLPASIFRVLEWRGMPDKRIPLTPSGLARNTIFIKPPFRRRPEIYCSPADVSVWPAWEPQVRSESWWLPNPMFFSDDITNKVVTVLDMTRPRHDWYFRLFRVIPFYCRCAGEIRYRVELIRKAIHIFMTSPI